MKDTTRDCASQIGGDCEQEPASVLSDSSWADPHSSPCRLLHLAAGGNPHRPGPGDARPGTDGGMDAGGGHGCGCLGDRLRRAAHPPALQHRDRARSVRWGWSDRSASRAPRPIDPRPSPAGAGQEGRGRGIIMTTPGRSFARPAAPWVTVPCRQRSLRPRNRLRKRRTFSSGRRRRHSSSCPGSSWKSAKGARGELVPPAVQVAQVVG